MPHVHTENRESGYPCRLACLLCDPAPVLDTLDQVAEHYIREHPISVMVPLAERPLRVVEQ
jgi:hypothetical protein